MEYVADLKLKLVLEKIKMLKTHVERHVTFWQQSLHKMILIFADETQQQYVIKCWESRIW